MLFLDPSYLTGAELLIEDLSPGQNYLQVQLHCQVIDVLETQTYIIKKLVVFYTVHIRNNILYTLLRPSTFTFSHLADALIQSHLQ